MKLKFHRKRITGILTVLPSREVSFEEEMENYNFSAAKSMKLKMAMGYNKHRIVEEGVCVSDLCVYGLNFLFENRMLRKEDIDALLLVTQSPDHFMPATSNIIQGKLGLGTDVFCMDINQGCCGFIVGLMEAFMLLEQESIRKVVLLNADVLSRKVSKRDRNSNPLTGDAATITIVEKSDTDTVIHGFLKMDGTASDALMIPAGGFRLPASEETGRMTEDAAGNFRSLDNLVMKGDEVFNFVQREVPPMIEELLQEAGCSKEKVDWYMFHQPNRFMLHKLADKLGVPHEKMPSNIVENFGNASGATIPTNISFNIGDRLKQEQYMFCLAGFGVGLTWGALLMNIGNLDFNEIIYY
ncbi:3-oxoacyl-ACP synthase III family protein [Culturomica massiliensis]|jgi:3-oxoacyl-[acyl-carrier-protein] synthase-3|uniref:3-oxoacyl-ACP synthase III family protein n=1 Tax=Culturomica massiliensis TaxID=1841857 RepID=UPI002355011C|nr:ketoacyl-ACP synthase III [Culturomica massiliensis]